MDEPVELKGLELSKKLAITLGWQEVENAKCHYSHSPKLQGIAPDEIKSKHTGYRAKTHVPDFANDLNRTFDSLIQMKHLSPVILYDALSDRWRCLFNCGLDGSAYQGEGDTAEEAICRSLILAIEAGQRPVRVNRMGQTY